MSGFRRDSVDVVDLTLMQKKGILKLKEPKLDNSSRVNSSGYVELLDNNSSLPSSLPSTSATTDNQFSFLDSLAQSSSQSSSPSPNMDLLSSLASVSSPTETSSNNIDGAKELNALKLKLDDFEFKLEQLLERLAKIESKLT